MKLRTSLPSLESLVIDETEDFVVIDKPPHLLAHPSKPDGSFTLWHALKNLLACELAGGGQISIINRLDRETSGLTLIAKNARTARKLSMLMERRQIEKEYLAIVWGWPENNEFVVNAPLARQGDHMPSPIWLKRMIHPDGAAAETRLKVEQRFTRQTSNGSKFSILRASPMTGRMHQIRVHLSHAGFPVVGDKIYGSSDANYLQFIETGWTTELELSLLLPRHALHSAALRIASDDFSGQWRSPLPPDLQVFRGVS